ncbi:MAG: FIG00455819: hypothetical protein [uncultured Paraburkholderia sp.]|nr:MAG: FIG00455819: hypothetical protein [uncultured Paraburkholderia sp.]CAH2945184.1 MAG: FIG00455819: hypothetical protein [uncultured Paraburkholderia sp.]
MKSRVINPFYPLVRATAQRKTTSGLRRASSVALMLGVAVCALSLSGCYYPYGYYPIGYYAPYAPYDTVPATVPAVTKQQDVQVGSPDTSATAAAQSTAPPPSQPVPASPPPTYAVAQPPVYVAPAYPAYYPPVYPAYYGYPGWYGPSVSIGFGGYWGGRGGWHGHYH